MLPGSSPERVDREAAKGKQSGRTQEIQRLIGRSLRAVTDLRLMPDMQITVDCDVLQADGGTRTASICGGWIALHDACTPPRRRRGELTTHPVLEAVRGDLGRRHRRHADARPRVLRGRARRGRHERRDDRRRTGSSRCRARPRASRSHAPSSTRCSSSPSWGSPRSSPPSRRWSPSRPRRAERCRCRCRWCSRPATPTRRARSSRSSSITPTSRWSPGRVTVGTDDVRLPPRRSGRDRGNGRRTRRRRSKRPTSRRRATRSKRTRASRRARSRARSACRRSPTTPGSRSTRSTARPACTRRATPVSGATLHRQRRQAARRARRARPTLRTARFATVAMARWPDGREIAVRGEVEGVIAPRRAGRSGFGYDPVFVPTEGDGRTFAEMSPAEKHAFSHRGRAFRALAEALLRPGGVKRAARSASPDDLRRRRRDGRCPRERRGAPSRRATVSRCCTRAAAASRRTCYAVGDRDADGVPVRVYRPSAEDDLPVVVYFHGGGWMIGSVDVYDAIDARSSRTPRTRSSCRSNTGLAPEHPYPDAARRLLDRVRVGRRTNTAVFGGDASRIAVAGDSAGGNLAAVVRVDGPRRGACRSRCRCSSTP